MTASAAVVHDIAGVPMPQITASTAVVHDSADAPMRAKGPKRPNHKLASVTFKQAK
jgi:hypothetical protein